MYLSLNERIPRLFAKLISYFFQCSYIDKVEELLWCLKRKCALQLLLNRNINDNCYEISNIL